MIYVDTVLLSIEATPCPTKGFVVFSGVMVLQLSYTQELQMQLQLSSSLIMAIVLIILLRDKNFFWGKHLNIYIHIISSEV